MEEISRDKFPSNGGWKFRQPQFGPDWENKMAMVGFNASVDYIRQARLKNKAISLKHRLSTSPSVIENELISYNKQIRGISDPNPIFHPSLLRFTQREFAKVDDIKRAANELSVLLDWLNNRGLPVEQSLAENRALVCLECSKHVQPPWYVVASEDIISETLESRPDMKLKTQHDKKIKCCDVFKCLMKVKLWMPLDFILSKTRQNILKECPERCWISRGDK